MAVANCFVRREQIFGYLEVCKKLGIRCILHETATPWAKDVTACAAKNLHGAPLSAIKKMKKAWQTITQEEVDAYLEVS